MEDPASYFEQIAQIDDDGRLYISGVINNWKPVHDRDITVVIDLEGGIDHGIPTEANEFLYVYLPIHDGDLPQLDRLHAVSDLVASLMSKGHRVLSHCGMGLNRSALVAGLALVRLGMTPADAIARIRERRPGALYNQKFAEYLLAAR